MSGTRIIRKTMTNPESARVDKKGGITPGWITQVRLAATRFYFGKSYQFLTCCDPYQGLVDFRVSS